MASFHLKINTYNIITPNVVDIGVCITIVCVPQLVYTRNDHKRLTCIWQVHTTAIYMYYITSYKANSDQFSHDSPQESLRTLLLLLMIIKLVLFLRVSRLQGSGGNFLSNELSAARRCQFDSDCRRLIYVPSFVNICVHTMKLGNAMLIFA